MVKKACAESIPVIQELARVTWAISYASMIEPDQVDYMLDLFYSTHSLEKQMQNGHLFIIASEDDIPLGFASYSPKTDIIGGVYRLHKLYIDPRLQGKGVGKTLLDHVLKTIQVSCATILELNVNRANKAIGFYQRLGFLIIREEDIDIGNGYFMNDFVMQKIIHE